MRPEDRTNRITTGLTFGLVALVGIGSLLVGTSSGRATGQILGSSGSAPRSWVSVLVSGQSFVRVLRDSLRVEFKALDPAQHEPENEIPQLIIGSIESVAYPWLLYDSDAKAALALVAAWLTGKSLGSWPGWLPRKFDKNIGRRRLYVYLVCNAFQLAWGALGGTGCGCARG